MLGRTMDVKEPEPPEQPMLLTVEEVAARLRVKPSWIYGHADALGAIRLGKYLRFLWPRVLERLDGKMEPSTAGTRTKLPTVVSGK